MKFYCDSCQAKYSIPDEKVRGKVLKVRCKKCSHVITVREPDAPRQQTDAVAGEAEAQSGRRASGTGGGAAAPPPTPGEQSLQWYYSVNGQSYGPLDRESLEQKFATGELGDATYVWNETFSDWKPVTAVAAFADALNDARDVRPSRNTMGAGQTLDAVDRSDLEEAGREGAPLGEEDEPADDEPVEERDSDVGATVSEGRGTDGASVPGGETEERAERPGLETDDEVETGDLNEDRLDKLRDRLDLDEEASELAETEEAAGDEPVETAGETDTPVPGESGESLAESDETEKGLDELRSKLGTADESEPAAAEETEEAGPVDSGPVSAAESSAVSEPEEDRGEPAFDGGVEAVDESEPESADFESAGPTDSSPSVEEPESRIDSEVSETPDGEPVEAGESEPAAEEGESHDGLFAEFEEGEQETTGSARPPEADRDEPTTDPDELQDETPEDAVPAFPSSAPKLGEDEAEDSTSMSRVGEMTDSLLIQINEIKSDGRKQKIAGVIGAIVALAVVGGVGYYASTEMGGDNEIEVEDEGPTGNVGGRPEFGEYSKEELAEVSDRIVLEEELEIPTEEEDDSSAGGGGGGQPSGGAGGSNDDGSGIGSVDPGAFRPEDSMGDSAAPSGQEDEVEAGTGGSRFGRPETDDGDGGGDSGSDGMAGLEGVDSDDGSGGEQNDRREAMAAIQSDREREIYDGDENVDVNRELQEGLTSQQMARGIEQVGESVSTCRQRHIMRGGSFDADEIKVSLTVTPDGNVSHYTMEPDSLDDTDFKRCMDSHSSSRWRFPRFKGDPVEIEAPFSLR